MTQPDRYTLLTNLDYVTVGDVRTMTHALLLVDAPHPLASPNFPDEIPRRCQLRGFGTDPAWPTFDLVVPSVDFKLEELPEFVDMSCEDRSGWPLFPGAIMRIEGAPLIRLNACDSSKPINVRTFEGSILQVWAVLPGLVRDHWTAPGFPSLRWGPTR